VSGAVPSDPGGGAVPTAPPHCYRHPQRETWIRCTRCERPICPDCMTPAPVGFQCPDCVAAGAVEQRGVRPAAAPFGGSVAERPLVTYTLVGLSVVAFGAAWLAGLRGATEDFGMWPVGIALDGEWYRMLTAVFLHASLLHIGFNMLVLVMIGPPLERVLGHVRFVVLYLLAGLGGSVASYMFSDPRVVSVGASGAIFGLMGALVVAGRRLRYDVTQVMVLIAINVAIGFLPGGGIDWRAHLGGLVTGAAVAAVFAFAPARSRLLWQSLGCLAILGVLVAVAMVRTAQLQALLAPLLQ
jgi:membrane associated rhomboid family serine protease